MKYKILKCIALILSMICILCFPIGVSATPQGTDGTELHVMQPQNLEIHLGEHWSGSAFQLNTDAGAYPGVITVGEDGVLRLEIGGSENYILRYVSSGDTELSQQTDETGAAEEPSVEPVPSESVGEEDAVPTEIPSEEAEEGTVAGIPVKHIALFGGGLILAIGALVVLQFCQKRGRISDEDNDI